MSSPTQGAWECRHGVDGRDEYVLQSRVQAVLDDPELGKETGR